MSSFEGIMQVGVIGGGLAGLCAAISLRDAGHKVVVYEKTGWSEDGYIAAPLGSGISFGANVSRILMDWGFDFNNAARLLQERGFEGRSFKLVNHLDFRYLEPATKFPWYEMRRGSLHTGILDIARKPIDGKPPIGFCVNTEAVKLDCELGKITFSDGRTVQHDLVVVADGIHSNVIHSVTNQTTPPIRAARTAIRFELSTSILEKDPLLGPLFKDEAPGMMIFTVREKGMFCILISGEGDQIYGHLMHPAIDGRDGSDRCWDVAASKHELIEYARDLHPNLQRLFELAQEPKLWTITCRDPITSCINGRAVAVGDACHPHLPHHGQGFGSSIEDAAALGIFFSPKAFSLLADSDAHAAIPTLLSHYQSFRLPRATSVQLMSISFPEKLEHLVPRWRNELGYDGPLPGNVDSHGQEVQLWLFQYDVRKEANEYLAKHSNI